MIRNKVSVIIPSRADTPQSVDAKFLQPTIDSVLNAAAGDVDIFVVLDGYWPDPPLSEDKRLHQIHRGSPQGMRQAINAAVALSRGEYLCKLDAHCAIGPGWDILLKEDIENDWVVVPRRYRLNPDHFLLGEEKPYEDRAGIDAHFLSYPYECPGDPSCGLHGDVWPQRASERRDVLIDDEMSSQGSCWFMSRRHWERMGPLDHANYGSFAQEFQEIGLRTWLGGGRVAVNKKTWYAHLHKGKRFGRGYHFAGGDQEKGKQFTTDYWMNNRWAGRAHDLEWLIDKFAPVPTWPGGRWANPLAKPRAVEILYAIYGRNTQSIDVKHVIEAHCIMGREVVVTNETFKADPLPGKRKELVVRAVVDGQEKRYVVGERGVLRFL